MKYLFILLASLLLFLTTGADVKASEFNARIIFIEGTVYVVSSNGVQRIAFIKDIINENDYIFTEAGSYCDIEFAPKTYSRIQPSSKIQILSLSREKKNIFGQTSHARNIQIKIESGEVLSKLKKLKHYENFKVSTPVAVVGVRGTIFSTSYTNNNFNISVVQGNVSVSNIFSRAVSIVPAGEKLTIRNNERGARPVKMLKQEISKLDINIKEQRQSDRIARDEPKHPHRPNIDPVENIIKTGVFSEVTGRAKIILRGKF